MQYDTILPELPDEARCWVYVADASLPAHQQEALLTQLRAFFGEWTSHGRAVTGAATIIGDRILLVGGHDEGGISGCGIDGSVRVVKAVGHKAGIEWVDPLKVIYRNSGGRIEVASRGRFRELLNSGEVTPETPVFDPSITTLEAVRAGRFEQPAHASWHRRVFNISSPLA